jgi:iron-sulfur cluster assembly accessory protein
VIKLTLSKQAADKLKDILKQEKKEGSMIRLYAQEGCCGAHYGMDFDEKSGKSDHVVEQHGIKLVMQKSLAPLLQGVKIEYVKSEHTEGFRIDNDKEGKDDKDCGGSCHCC